MIIEYRHRSYSTFLPGPSVVQRRGGIVPFHWMLLVPGSHWYQVLFRSPVVRFPESTKYVSFFMTFPQHIFLFSSLLLSHTVICILPKDAQFCSPFDFVIPASRYLRGFTP